MIEQLNEKMTDLVDTMHGVAENVEALSKRIEDLVKQLEKGIIWVSR